MSKKRREKQKARLQQATSTPKGELMSYALVLVLLGFILYANTIGHGFALDDFSVIADNWLIQQGFSGIPTILSTSYRHGYIIDLQNLYRPLSLVMFAIEWELLSNTPWFHHLINVLIYAAIGGGLLLTLSRIMHQYHFLLPLLTTIFFIAHPLHTEVAANIKSRDELLSFGLLLLTLYFLWQSLDARQKVKPLLISLVCYFGSFMARESAITFLAVIPLTLYFFSNKSLSQQIRLSALYLLPALAYIGIRYAVLGQMTATGQTSVLSNFLVGAPDKASQVATAIQVLGKYLYLLVIPHPLISDYNFNQVPITSWNNFTAIFSLLGYIVLAILGVYFILKKKLLGYAIGFYLVTLSIFSNLIITIGAGMAERFLFVPSLGFALALALGLVRLFRIDLSDASPAPVFGRLFSRHKLLLTVGGIILFGYGFKTIDRNKAWENSLILHRTDLQNAPNSATLHCFYGMELMNQPTTEANQQKNTRLAIREFRKATEIFPAYADAYERMGLAYYNLGDIVNALKHYQHALQHNPHFARAYSNMGIIFFEKKEYAQALELYKKAVEFDPKFADAYQNLGSTYGSMGQHDKAIENFLKVLQFQPDNVLIHHYLGMAYGKKGDIQKSNYYKERARALGQGK